MAWLKRHNINVSRLLFPHRLRGYIKEYGMYFPGCLELTQKM